MSSNQKCPKCNGNTVRIQRRPIDRFRSLFGLVHRYKCISYHCKWKGNIRKTSPENVISREPLL